MKKSSSLLKTITPVVFTAVIIGIGIMTRQQWMPWFQTAQTAEAASEKAAPVEEPKILKLSKQARKNLELVSKPAIPETYWRVIQIPGKLVDRPGVTDRGVTSPAVGVVSNIHAFPGDTIRPGDRLLSLRLFSEYLQATQKELFAATKEIEITREELNRLIPLAKKGGLPQSKIIELQNKLRRQEALIQSHRQDLLTRGLAPRQIEDVAGGTFVSEIDIVAPPLKDQAKNVVTIQQTALQEKDSDEPFAYEVQELNAELGQQVQAGQLLATLANHGSLYIEGHAFKREASYLEQTASNSWPIRVEFAEDDAGNWPSLNQEFEIRHLSNSIDPDSRTFDFYIPLSNQSRAYRKDGQTFVVWRFRPGQRVRLYVPVEEMTDVIVLPSAGVVREGPEAYVFQQNGDLFNRIPVQVLHEDRLNIVIANDGSITPGLFLAQNGAASLNRVMKAQAASGMKANVHVHADGTVHESH
ncbi:MAG: efflux RND transporter periplasmic adaptor subunit [Planctomycetaceae bacterium]|nr:efflux RND transporter periplasmic adaptor subunit [Planctomycetaceae bacterium]